VAYGFQQSKADYTLFTKSYGHGNLLAVLVYVDDMILIASNSSLADLKKYLHTQFHVKDLGTLHYFLGLEIIHSSKGIFMCQKKYT